MKEKVILHCDLNSFYASVECLYHPDVRHLPVAVAGDKEKRHGIILTKNQIAKEYGIKTGEAIWQARKKCPNLVIFSPNYDLYQRYSELVRQIFYDYTDLIEPFGLDEAWLDVSGSTHLFGDGKTIADTIRNRVKNELGVTMSVGVSWNKVFAKLGSDYKKPDATTVITHQNMEDIVWPLPVEDLLFVGPATKTQLNSLGIETIGDLACTTLSVLKEHFGKEGPVLWAFANGLGDDSVKPFGVTDPIKSVGNSSTRPRDICSINDLKSVCYSIAESVAARLRAQSLTGRVLKITIRDSHLKVITRQHKLDYYTNSSKEIAEEALKLFYKYSLELFPLRSVGISISDLKEETLVNQLSIFTDQSQRDKQLRLEKSIDMIRNRFGKDAVTRTIMAIDPKMSGFHNE